MNKQFVPILAILFFSLTHFACNMENENKIPETPSTVLKEFVSEAKHQYINLDSYKLNHQKITDDNIIFKLNFNNEPNNALMGHLTKYTFSNFKFFIYDTEVKSIFGIDTVGVVEGPLTTQGRGPGEHISVGNIKSNKHFIYATDAFNGRINLYSHKLVPKTSLQGFTSLFEIDLNDNIILTVNQKSIGINPLDANQGVIAISSIADLTDTLATIFPRIIPEGYQPAMYNIPKFSLNSNNLIIAMYQFLPWIFIYDEDYNHQLSLIFEYSKFDKMDIPKMDFFKELDNEGFGGDFPFTGLKIMQNNHIFLYMGSELIHLIPSDGSYEIAGKYIFTIEGEQKPVWISDIFSGMSENEYFIGSWYKIFRFKTVN